MFLTAMTILAVVCTTMVVVFAAAMLYLGASKLYMNHIHEWAARRR